MKGGISETRIEKRIVITGDTEIDHDKVRNTLCLFPFKRKTVSVFHFVNDTVNVVSVHFGRKVSVERYMVKMYV